MHLPSLFPPDTAACHLLTKVTQLSPTAGVGAPVRERVLRKPLRNKAWNALSEKAVRFRMFRGSGPSLLGPCTLSWVWSHVQGLCFPTGVKGMAP